MRLHGQAVKTSPFHGGNPGSIPGGVTKKKDGYNFVSVFFLADSRRGAYAEPNQTCTRNYYRATRSCSQSFATRTRYVALVALTCCRNPPVESPKNRHRFIECLFFVTPQRKANA